MKSRLIVGLLLFFSISGISNSLKLEILNSTSKRVLLVRIYGSKFDTVKSVPLKNSIAEFNTKNLPSGLYKVDLNGPMSQMAPQKEHKIIDVIINNEDIKMKMDYSDPMGTMTIVSSEENKLFYDFNKEVEKIDSKLLILERSLKQYPGKKDTFYKNTLLEVKSLRNQKQAVVKKFSKKNSKTLFSNMITFDKPVDVPENLSQEKSKEYEIDNFFKNTKFTDTTLFNTNVISRKIQAFFAMYVSQKGKDVEDQLIEALDIVMSNASVNNSMFSFVAGDIQFGFKNYAFDRFYSYLIENYLLTEKCESAHENSPGGKQYLQNRLKNYKLLAEGKTAPDIEVNHKNKNVKLSDIDAKYKLLVFWATTCAHCRKTLPELHKVYDRYKNKGFEIIAVSVDTDKFQYEQYLNRHKFNWISVANLVGWNCPITKKYHVYATPMEFLMDRNNNIVLRPKQVRELENFLSVKL